MAELLQRAERLQYHVEVLRREVDQLRRDLQCLHAESTSESDCLCVALALAEDLGPGFSSEDPHGLAERGNDWFQEP